MKTSIPLICLCTGTLIGCHSPPTGFDSPVPSKRMDAAVAAAGEGDESSIPDLIEMLDSDDALVRLISIRTLERLTGKTLGYDHAAPEWERSAAADRWTAWAADNGIAPTQAEDLNQTSPKTSFQTPLEPDR